MFTRRSEPESRLGSGVSASTMRRFARWLPFQRLCPFLPEFLEIDELVTLDPGEWIDSGAGAFEMHDLACGFVDDAPPCGANGKGQVHVLAVRRGIARIEAAHLLEEVARNQQGCAGYIVGVPPIEVAWIFTRLESTDIPAFAVGEHQAACFLKPPVGVDQAAAHNSALRLFVASIDQSVQPSGHHLGVVVEEDQQGALGRAGTAIATAYESEIALVAQDTQTGNGGEHAERFVLRCIVHDDHLEARARGMTDDGPQAGQGPFQFAVDGNDDRHFRCGGTWNRGRFRGAHRVQKQGRVFGRRFPEFLPNTGDGALDTSLSQAAPDPLQSVFELLELPADE